MTAKEFLARLIEDLEKFKAKGQKVVPIDGLVKVLGDLQAVAGTDVGEHTEMIAEAHLETYRATTAFDLEHYKARVEGKSRMFDSVMVAAKAAIQSLFLMNGGGCVALLTLIGQLVPKLSGGSIKYFAGPLIGFAAGVGLATFAACAFVLTQKAYHGEWKKSGRALEWLAIAAGFASLGAFGYGCYVTYRTLVHADLTFA